MAYKFSFTENQTKKIDAWIDEHNKFHQRQAAGLDADDRAALTTSRTYEYFFQEWPPLGNLYMGCRCVGSGGCGQSIEFLEDDEE